ncbi:hypothetical protein PENTCL1PPCAC_8449, partial [Pristionchus entomophagus]
MDLLDPNNKHNKSTGGDHLLLDGVVAVLALEDAENLGSSGGLALDDLLSVVVELQLGDSDVGGVDSDVDGRSVRLLTDDLVNVDDELLAVHAHDASRVALVVTTGDGNLIVHSDGNGADSVLSAELLGEGSRHHLPLDVGRSGEVTLVRLSPVGGHERVLLHVTLEMNKD